MLDKDSSLDLDLQSQEDREEVESGAGADPIVGNEEDQEFDDSFLDVEAIKEKERQKTLESHIKKAKELIAEGKDLPESLQYVTKYLESDKSEKKEKKQDIDRDALKREIIEEMKNEAKEDMKFEQLKSSLKDLKMSKTQRLELQDEFSDLIQAGISKSKALEKALRLAGLNQSQRKAFDMPEQGASAKAPDVDSMSDDDFLKWSAEMGAKSKSLRK